MIQTRIHTTAIADDDNGDGVCSRRSEKHHSSLTNDHDHLSYAQTQITSASNICSLSFSFLDSSFSFRCFDVRMPREVVLFLLRKRWWWSWWRINDHQDGTRQGKIEARKEEENNHSSKQFHKELSHRKRRGKERHALWQNSRRYSLVKKETDILFMSQVTLRYLRIKSRRDLSCSNVIRYQPGLRDLENVTQREKEEDSGDKWKKDAVTLGGQKHFPSKTTIMRGRGRRKRILREWDLPSCEGFSCGLNGKNVLISSFCDGWVNDSARDQLYHLLSQVISVNLSEANLSSCCHSCFFIKFFSCPSAKEHHLSNCT